MSRPRPTIISISGIDGAGKSTQIAALKASLREAGLRVSVLEFWDNVVAFARFREFMSRKAFGGDAGVGSPEKPIDRRDKNVTSWPATLMRLFFYLADSLSLRVAVRRMERSGADVVIFDRYIYDELANLPLQFDAIRFFVKAVLRVVPKPDAAFLIDADPAAARARKPEYPLEFLYRNRESYLVLSHLVGDMIVVEPQSVEAAQAKMRRSVAAKLPLTISEQSPIVLLP